MGRLVPICRDVFRIPGAPVSWMQRVHATVLSAPGSLASHITAAALWGMPDPHHRPIHVVQPRDLNHDRALGLVHQAPWLPDHQHRDIDGIPVVSPAVTLFQLAGMRPQAWVERLVDDSLVRKLIRTKDLERVAWSLCRRGRPGSAAFRRIVDARGTGFVATESELEARFLRLVRKAGLPEPEKQVNVGGDAWIGRVDFLFRLAQLIVELDGRRHQTALLQAREDKRRDIELVRSGRRVIRLHWDEINGKPKWVADLLWDLVGPSLAA